MRSDADGLTIARARIAREREQRGGLLDLGSLGLTEWPNELWDLDHLVCLNLGIGWTDDKAGFHFATPGLAYAPNVLDPAAACWARLPQLHTLSLAGPRGDGSAWDSLAGLEHLPQLRVLDISWTEVDDLTPLAALHHLEVLDASYTFVSDLAALKTHLSLRHLDLSHTDIRDLAPLGRHTALQTLLCYHTPLKTVAPLAGLVALTKLDLTQTRVTSLDSLATLPSLQILHCPWAPVESLSESLVNLPSLQKLILYENAISNVPVEVLSQDGATDCLERVRAYFQETKAQSA